MLGRRCWMRQTAAAFVTQVWLIPVQPHSTETDLRGIVVDQRTLDISPGSHSLPSPSSHSAAADFKQPVAEPATSFNSGIPRSLEHHLIILVIIPATPTVPPLLHNGIQPEFEKKRKDKTMQLFHTSLFFI